MTPFVPAELGNQALLHYFDKATGRKSRKPPQFAKRGTCLLDPTLSPLIRFLL